MDKRSVLLVGYLYCASHLYGVIITGGPQLCLVVLESEWHKINEDPASPPLVLRWHTHEEEEKGKAR